MEKKADKLRDFYLLWSTQALSQLGSAITAFALTLWIYEKSGSALHTALLTICNYVPYVLMSIIAGAMTDRWDKKKTMLVCDLLAALGTIVGFVLIRRDLLQEWHLYVINALNGLMNTVQQPASEVAVTLVTPKEMYQKTSGLKSFSRSLISIMHPVIATALFGFGGMNVVIAFDLLTFAVAFLVLLLFIEIPSHTDKSEGEPLIETVRQGFRCLNENRAVLWLILFLAGVNLVASMFDAVLPAFIIPQPNGGEKVLAYVTATAGVAMLVGSLIVSVMPAPKDRILVILATMLFSLTTDNFLMALSDSPILWCIAQVLGYVPVTIMSTNLDVTIRETIPTDMQGRVYACRNSLQFFTIPLGYYLGGWLTDMVFEPYMAGLGSGHVFLRLFGEGKGSGAGMLIFLLGVAGMVICTVFWKILDKYRNKAHA
ncbi:MAG: MFS transporter [Oscillospiraceae bacterium]|nr:MFS transporter [Oscillospiraceae bacterium]